MTLDTAKTSFPVGKTVRFTPGRSLTSIDAEVTGHRQNGGSVFIETKDSAGKERSIRPGSCVVV